MLTVIFDCETTGLPPPAIVPLTRWPRVIEVACLVVENTKIIESYSQLLDPECPIPEKITKITGITDADVKGQPKFAKVLPALHKHFGRCGRAVAHNFEFDRVMLDSEIWRALWVDFPWPQIKVCTIQQYEHLFGRWLKQGELYQHFMGRPQAKAHRALDDVLALFECLVAANYFEESHDEIPHEP